MVNVAKEKVQFEARQNIDRNLGNGLVIMATGGGKTKIAIDYIADNDLKAVWLTPSTQMRDVDTPAEFEKWGHKEYFEEKVSIHCYAMAHKLKDLDVDIIILDEVHKVTELRSEFFFDNNNKFESVLAFTATMPDDEIKLDIFERLDLKVLYKLSVDEAVKRGVIAPFQLNIIKIPLSDTIKFKGGGKSNPYYTTEYKYYRSLDKALGKMMAEGKEIPMQFFMRRANFLYNLKSKVAVSKALIESLGKDKRIIIFSKRKAIAASINKNVYHSTSDKNSLNNFRDGLCNILSVVDSINEGVNFPEIDIVILNQINSVDREFIQKIGRGLRFREGYTAQIYLLVAEGTKDEKWIEQAIRSIGQDNIKFIDYRNYVEQI